MNAATPKTLPTNLSNNRMLSRIEELKLAARCALSDDRDAFCRIVEAYETDVRRFIANLTGGDLMLADDLAQETFIKAYMSIRSFRGLARLRTWLFRIAYNEFCSHERKKSEEALNERMPEPAIASTAHATEAQIDVQRALLTLSPAERTVTVLFYIDDKPLREIAAITGMPEGTIKSHLSRAKSKIAKFFNE